MRPRLALLALPISLALVLAAAAMPARATAIVSRLGSAGAWEAFLDNDSGGKICYLVGKPKKTLPAGAKRGEIRLSVTHRPAHKVANVVNFSLGYHPKDGADATLMIGSRKFQLFTDKDGAWAHDADTDLAVVTALVKSRDAVLTAVPAQGTATTDRYDLTGFGDALVLIDRACGIAR
jgi:Invasion associated locus B (IalB) protein